MSFSLPRIRACTWVLIALSAAPMAQAQTTLFRFNDLDLRDPHVFVNPGFGCTDITDTGGANSINGRIQTSIQNDGNGDGFLDRSSVVEFLPLDQGVGVVTNLFDSGRANCTAPMATTQCGPINSRAIMGDATLSSSTTCLTPIAGTLSPITYLPAVSSSTAPCFASPVGTVTLDLGGIEVPLSSAQIAATFVGNPATSLTNGLLRGFITESDANALILPAGLPFIGGQPLSSLLPGGAGNCAAHSDKDMLSGVPGWWLYLNFSGPRVERFIDNFAGGFANGFEP